MAFAGAHEHKVKEHSREVEAVCEYDEEAEPGFQEEYPNEPDGLPMARTHVGERLELEWPDETGDGTCDSDTDEQLERPESEAAALVIGTGIGIRCLRSDPITLLLELGAASGSGTAGE